MKKISFKNKDELVKRVIEILEKDGERAYINNKQLQDIVAAHEDYHNDYYYHYWETDNVYHGYTLHEGKKYVADEGAYIKSRKGDSAEPHKNDK